MSIAPQRGIPHSTCTAKSGSEWVLCMLVLSGRSRDLIRTSVVCYLNSIVECMGLSLSERLFSDAESFSESSVVKSSEES